MTIIFILIQKIKFFFIKYSTDAHIKAEQIFTKVGADIEKLNHLMPKAEGIIQMRVAQQYHTLLANKSAGEMWRTLRTKFQDIATMSITEILYNMSFKRMTEYESAVKYCAEYEKALNSIKGMIEENSELRNGCRTSSSRIFVTERF